MKLRRPALAGVALVALLLSACAPPPRPGELTSFATRYQSERTRREQRLQSAELEMVVRLEGRATGRLPGLLVSGTIAGPDHLRLRAGWMLGTALELVAIEDSVRVWLPTEHAVLEVGGLEQELHQPQPVALMIRALSASWDPPASAWLEATVDSTQVRLGWRQGADSLSMRVDGASRPLELRIESGARGVSIHYAGWRKVNGVDWPTRMELTEREGWLRLRTELQALRSNRKLAEDSFILRTPPDVKRLDWQQVRERLQARGEGTP